MIVIYQTGGVFTFRSVYSLSGYKIFQERGLHQFESENQKIFRLVFQILNTVKS
jgi:hypothetical protein